MLGSLGAPAHGEERPDTRFTSNLFPATRVFSVAPGAEKITEERAYRNWKLSLVPVFASQTLDVASSYGMRELNPMLADANGRFGSKGVSMKLGTTAAIVTIEYLIVRKHPKAARLFSKLNWAGSAVTTGFVVHNYAIR
jgi:hypothetical protein